MGNAHQLNISNIAPMPRILLILSLINVLSSTAQSNKKGAEKHVQVLMAGNYIEDPEAAKNSALQEQQKALGDFAKERSNANAFYYQCAGQSSVSNPPAPDNADNNNVSRSLQYCLTQYRNMMQDIDNRQTQWQQGFNKKYATILNITAKAKPNTNNNEKPAPKKAGNDKPNPNVPATGNKELTFYVFLYVSVDRPRGTGLEALRDPPSQIVTSTPIMHKGKIEDDLSFLKPAFADRVIAHDQYLGKAFTDDMQEWIARDKYWAIKIQYTAPYISKPLLTEEAAWSAISAFQQNLKQTTEGVGELEFVQMQ